VTRSPSPLIGHHLSANLQQQSVGISHMTQTYAPGGSAVAGAVSRNSLGCSDSSGLSVTHLRPISPDGSQRSLSPDHLTDASR
jgi:hypothetical protein